MIRSAGASLAAVAVEFALLTLLVALLHFHYMVGALLSGAAYFVVNFLINRRWAFRSRDRRVVQQLLRHSMVTGGAMALGTPLLWVFASQIGLPYQIAWVIAGIIGFCAWTFPMHRHFTYRDRLGRGRLLRPRWPSQALSRLHARQALRACATDLGRQRVAAA